eukprot:scaffold87519_cov99-Phaeocystis_antarctica.AAC.1
MVCVRSGAGQVPRPYATPTPLHTLKTTELTADSSEIGHTTQDCVTQDCVGSATSPCRGAHA